MYSLLYFFIQLLMDHTQSLFLGSLFYSIGLYVLFLCWYHTVLITIDNILKSSMVPTTLVSFKIILALQGPLRFHVNDRMYFSVSEKQKQKQKPKATGILVAIVSNLWIPLDVPTS